MPAFSCACQVLTDRAFLSKPKTMVKAFLVGGSIAIMFIVLFGFIGIYGELPLTLLSLIGLLPPVNCCYHHPPHQQCTALPQPLSADLVCEPCNR